MKPWVIALGLVILVILIIVAFNFIFPRQTSIKLRYYSVGPNEYIFSYTKILDVFDSTCMIPYQDGFLLTQKTGELNQIRGNHQTVLLDMKEHPKFTSISEGGLLSVAIFNDKIYLSYTLKSDRPGYTLDLVVGEYIPTSTLKLRTILSIPCLEAYHHAGTLQPYGKYLYLSTGDGGPQGDPHNQAQKSATLLGKILRITPQTGQTQILAKGLRNPWRFSIDEQGRMFIGDVGHDTSEKIDLIPDLKTNKIYNFGWNYYEGSHQYREGRSFSDFDHPIFEYPTDKSTGRAVIGGYFVGGVYIFADYLGFVRIIELREGVWVQTGFDKWEHGSINSMALDEKVFLLAKNGVYTIDFKHN